MRTAMAILAAVVMTLSAGQAASAGQKGSGCAVQAPAGSGSRAELSLEQFTPEEMKVIRYVADQIELQAPTGRIHLTPEGVMANSGASEEAFESLDEVRVLAAARVLLARRGYNPDALLNASTCARFSACSIDRDLSGAGDEELAAYEAEKATDGQPGNGRMAPDFELSMTTGGTHRLSSHRGRTVVVAFLSGHCNHSLQTLKILSDLRGDYPGESLAILPVYINSGSVEDVDSWTSRLDLSVPVLVAADRRLSEQYSFRMVPTLFLVDEEGRIVKKLVGQKGRSELAAAIEMQLSGDERIARR